MAAAIFSRRAAPLSRAFEKLLFSARPAAAPAARRAYNNSAEITESETESETDSGRGMDVYRRSGDAPSSRRHRGDDSDGIYFAGFGNVKGSESFDPFFGPSHSISQLLNKMEQLADSPFVASRVPSSWRSNVVREDKDALYIKVDMPGLGKENVRVTIEQNTLVLKGEGEKESDEEVARRYSTRIDLPSELLKLDQVKAEMKNGVLKVVVPKVKEEERKDVFQVSVE